MFLHFTIFNKMMKIYIYKKKSIFLYHLFEKLGGFVLQCPYITITNSLYWSFLYKKCFFLRADLLYGTMVISLIIVTEGLSETKGDGKW